MKLKHNVWKHKFHEIIKEFKVWEIYTQNYGKLEFVTG